MNVTIEKSTISRSIAAPPSKSYAHRMMICAALAGGKSVIRGISESEDMAATLDCIRTLGALAERSGDTVIIEGIGDSEDPKERSDELPVFPCRESGSTLRFFIPIALACCRGGIFTGTSRLIERGVGIYEDLFRECGIAFEIAPERIQVKGELRAGSFSLPGNVSSQFISGLMFALPLLKGNSIIEVTGQTESRAYIDITMDVLKQFGVNIRENAANVFEIEGGQKYLPQVAQVEGDWSNAAFLYALRELQKADRGSGGIEITGLNPESIQGDRVCTELLRQLESPGAVIDVSGCPDLGPILFAMAAAGNGGRFTGIRRLRIKESDRVQTMCDELARFGADCTATENELIVPAGELQTPKEPLWGHNDHRIVMAMAVLLTVTGGCISGAEAVKKSYPDFFETIKNAGIKLKTEYNIDLAD